MYRYLLFDFDNTIMDFTKTEQLALKKAVHEICGRDITDEEVSVYHAINDGYWKRLEKKEVNREQLKYGRFADFTKAIGIENVDVNVLNRRYMDCLAETVVEYPDSYKVLKELSGRYRIYIITNGTTYIQKGRLAGTSFRDLVRRMFISDEIGADKPAVEFFGPIIRETGDADLSRYLVIGDSVTSDIRFGKRIGVDTCYVGAEGSGADYTIAGIGDLPELLKRIDM